MAKFHRFEDALPPWRAQAQSLLAAGQEPTAAPDAAFARLGPACLSWMAAAGCWPNTDADMARVEAEILAALHHLTLPTAPAERVEVAGSAWAVPAAGGAALGALLVSPLTWIWLGNRAIGLFIGATLGAYLAVRGLAMLLERPALVAAVRSAATLSGGGMVVGGVWRAIRGQSIGLFRSVMWLAVAPLLLTLLQKQMTQLRAGPSRPGAGLRQADRTHLADLALAVCWAHPDRLSPRPPAVRSGTEALTGAVWLAISRLRTEWQRGKPDKELAAACEELFQRFEEDGYEWRFVPRGQPYTAELVGTFDSFGAIAPGQPVRTRRAAIARQGQIIQKGEVRRA
ncbi:conserved membrane protein of unknown function [Rhodovastum atsumiense]|uniref:hypothetical protein n=1 Tax=Rhodovastum atsumiense TaxID=504468 RepID=UPI00139F2A6E|nr:hypothetical protein [Rhodovastum atsumiense]CAH2598634.1 conserved membrane protein of unknown function [Rhodovastum atsumiense]